MSTLLTKVGLIPSPQMDTPAYDLDIMRSLVQGVSRLELEEEEFLTQKLCIYRKVRCFDKQACLAKTKITCHQRSLVAKLLCRILLELETLQYQGIDEKDKLAGYVGLGQWRMKYTSSSTVPVSRKDEGASPSCQIS